MSYRENSYNNGSNSGPTTFFRNIKNNNKKFALPKNRRTTDATRLLTRSEAKNLRHQRVSSFIEKCYKAIEWRKASKSLTPFERDVITKVLGEKEVLQ